MYLSKSWLSNIPFHDQLFLLALPPIKAFISYLTQHVCEAILVNFAVSVQNYLESKIRKVSSLGLSILSYLVQKQQYEGD